MSDTDMRSGHWLRITLTDTVVARLTDGYLALPETVDDHIHEIVCVGPSCSENGYTECREEHICEHGCDARFGPEENDPDDKTCPGYVRTYHTEAFPEWTSMNCWYDEEEFEFHGQLHTWRYEWGWTIPFNGCIVQANCSELPDNYKLAPIGEYELTIDWDDETTCYLDMEIP